MDRRLTGSFRGRRGSITTWSSLPPSVRCSKSWRRFRRRRLDAPAASPAGSGDRRSVVGPLLLMVFAPSTLMVIALYALPAVAMTRPVDDADVWWHLRTGQWVVEHGAVPQTDPFSAYGEGRPWLAYSWLFEVIVYGFYHWLGLTGLLVFRLAASGAVLVAVHRFVLRRESRLLWATGLTLLAFLTISGMLYERPWLFTL